MGLLCYQHFSHSEPRKLSVFSLSSITQLSTHRLQIVFGLYYYTDANMCLRYRNQRSSQKEPNMITQDQAEIHRKKRKIGQVSILIYFGKSYYNSANLRPSVHLSFDFHGNRSHGALRARPMCCSEPDDVPFLFEFVRMWSSYTIKRLCVVFAGLHRQRCCRIPPTVSQERFIPQLIARGLPFNQKLHRLSKTVH